MSAAAESKSEDDSEMHESKHAETHRFRCLMCRISYDVNIDEFVARYRTTSILVTDSYSLGTHFFCTPECHTKFMDRIYEETKCSKCSKSKIFLEKRGTVSKEWHGGLAFLASKYDVTSTYIHKICCSGSCMIKIVREKQTTLRECQWPLCRHHCNKNKTTGYYQIFCKEHWKQYKANPNVASMRKCMHKYCHQKCVLGKLLCMKHFVIVYNMNIIFSYCFKRHEINCWFRDILNITCVPDGNSWLSSIFETSSTMYSAFIKKIGGELLPPFGSITIEQSIRWKKIVDGFFHGERPRCGVFSGEEPPESGDFGAIIVDQIVQAEAAHEKEIDEAIAARSAIDDVD
jgi:hypothetical protein